MIERRTYRVFAFTASDATESAKHAAHEEGWTVRTVCRVRLLGRVEGGVREWEVELAVAAA